MNEDIVADITGRFFLNRSDDDRPVKGRIILTKRRFVFASSNEKETIALSKIIDINVGSVPNHVKQFFDDTVTVAYKADGSTQTAIIESKGETVEKLVAILFRCLLNGKKAAIQHPKRVGGRVKNTSIAIGELRLKNQQVAVRTKSQSVSFDVANVMQIDRANKIGDDDRITLVVKHVDSDTGQTTTTLIAPAKGQHVNLLARYLRLEFDELREEIEEIQLSNPEKRLLVSIHATDGDIDFTNMLDGDAAYVTNVLNSVQRKQLVVENGTDLSLTPRGRIVVSEQIEDVNA
ncbi:CheF family chemotaxis protein [Natronobacterium texcoconense]|uniref:HTH domain-containing protein n=1 Tax=Natronobacterium texcoconense TaxID=1095778 RepID=A0A1H1IL64_NATTX|nr:CheF family chemotaxis protein [Natronobacterium texcoconense]SDR38309.1 HTH domain-containing protein [Natronobacterium texcoconense]